VLLLRDAGEVNELLADFPTRPATLAPHGFTVAVPRAALDAFSGSASVAFETIPLLEQLLKEEAQELSTEYLPDTVDSAIISPPMPPKEVVLGDHIIDIVSELQSQARLGSETKRQPSPYPHENVVFHVGQLQAEALRKAEQPDRLMTLKEVADLYPDELTYDDVRRWHYSGLLEEQGRRWLARPGGRSIPLVSQLEVAYLRDNRPPRGPIEGFKQKMKEHIDRLKHELVKSRS
jgi:hypothetical protein